MRCYLKAVKPPGVGRKLYRKWDGPYRVMKSFGRDRYEILDLRNRRSKLVHADNLKMVPERCIDPDELPDPWNPFPGFVTRPKGPTTTAAPSTNPKETDRPPHAPTNSYLLPSVSTPSPLAAPTASSPQRPPIVPGTLPVRPLQSPTTPRVSTPSGTPPRCPYHSTPIPTHSPHPLTTTPPLQTTPAFNTPGSTPPSGTLSSGFSGFSTPPNTFLSSSDSNRGSPLSSPDSYSPPDSVRRDPTYRPTISRPAGASVAPPPIPPRRGRPTPDVTPRLPPRPHYNLRR